MAEISLASATTPTAVLMGNPPGRSAGLGLARPNHLFEWSPVPPTDVNAEGTLPINFVQGGLGAATQNEVTGSTESVEAFLWHERIHLIPDDATLNASRAEGGKIAFGSILAQTDREYEIYNAYRSQSTSLTALTNPVTPGVELPEVAAGAETLDPQTSLLAAASTQNTGLTTGLGTAVRTKVRALQDGLPNFDGTITFSWSVGGDVGLPVSGARLVLITAEYEQPTREVMRFATDVNEKKNGKEQRISLRAAPREAFIVQFRLDDTDRQRLQILLMDWQANNFGLPLWHERVKLSTSHASGVTQLQVTGADDVDFRVGGLLAIIKDGLTFDVGTISAKTDTLLTVSNATQNAYSAGDFVMPVRIARISRRPTGGRYLNTLEDFSFEFESVDNTTGAPTESSSAWNGNTYNSRPLLDENNISGAVMPISYEQVIFVADNVAGNPSQTSAFNKNQRVHRKGFSANGRTQVANLKKFLRWARGRQKAFYIPTFAEELTITDTLTATSAIMDIKNVGYVRHGRNREPKKIFRVTFTDDTQVTHTITSSAAHPSDSTKERLTISPVWAATKAASDVKRVEFLELVRFDTDEFTIRYPHLARANVRAPVRVVFDDDTT